MLCFCTNPALVLLKIIINFFLPFYILFSTFYHIISLDIVQGKTYKVAKVLRRSLSAIFQNKFTQTKENLFINSVAELVLESYRRKDSCVCSTVTVCYENATKYIDKTV